MSTSQKKPVDHQERQRALLEAAKPLIKHLAQNYHPHHKAIVTGVGIELMEGVVSDATTEFLED